MKKHAPRVDLKAVDPHPGHADRRVQVVLYIPPPKQPARKALQKGAGRRRSLRTLGRRMRRWRSKGVAEGSQLKQQGPAARGLPAGPSLGELRQLNVGTTFEASRRNVQRWLHTSRNAGRAPTPLLSLTSGVQQNKTHAEKQRARLLEGRREHVSGRGARFTASRRDNDRRLHYLPILPLHCGPRAAPLSASSSAAAPCRA